jgi:S1-C subfamily serine protease
MSALIELQTAVQQATERISPAVVAVGRGAGVIVGPDRILTNAHNLTGPEVEVRLADGHTERAAVLGADLDGDLAVLRVATGAGPVADWADDGPGLGAAVLALGAPRRGPVAGHRGVRLGGRAPFRGPRGRRLRGFEHTAPVGRGSSGGPVVDLEGRVVGIDTHRRGDGPLPGPAGIQPSCAHASSGSVVAKRHPGAGSASRWRRPPSPPACAPPSG